MGCPVIATNIGAAPKQFGRADWAQRDHRMAGAAS